MTSAFVRDEPIRDQWLFWGFIGLLFWAPLPLASNRTWAIGVLLVWSLLLFLGTLYVWRGQMARAWDILAGYRWPLAFLLAFTSWTWLQSVPLPGDWVAWLSPENARLRGDALFITGPTPHTLSIDPFQSRIYATLSVIYLLAFIMALLFLRHPGRIDRLAAALVWSGFLQSMLAAALYSAGADYRLFFTHITHDRTLGSYVYTNAFAGYLEMTLSVGIGLMLARIGHGGSAGGRAWRDWLAAALRFMLSPKMRLRLMLVVMVIALVLTRSRMGNTAFFAAMLIVGIIAIALSRRAARATVVLIASLVVVDIFIIGSWIGLEKVVHRVQETALSRSESLSEQSVQERIEPAGYAMALVRDFPVTGTGGGSFYQSFSRYRPPEAGAYYDHTHNDYIEIAADTGLVGSALLGGLVAFTLATLLSVLRHRANALARGMAFGVLMAMTALIIHSFVDFNLQIPANALTLTVILALGWSSARAIPRGSPHRHPRGDDVDSVR